MLVLSTFNYGKDVPGLQRTKRPQHSLHELRLKVVEVDISSTGTQIGLTILPKVDLRAPMTVVAAECIHGTTY